MSEYPKTWEQAAHAASRLILAEHAERQGQAGTLRETFELWLGSGEPTAQDFRHLGAHAFDEYLAPLAISAAVMDNLVAVICQKQHDYGHENIAAYGTTGLKVRINDKLARLENLQRRGDKTALESYEDTLMDIVGYCIVGIMWCNDTFMLPLQADIEPMPEPHIMRSEPMTKAWFDEQQTQWQERVRELVQEAIEQHEYDWHGKNKSTAASYSPLKDWELQHGRHIDA
jgi:hypothetical protein